MSQQHAMTLQNQTVFTLTERMLALERQLAQVERQLEQLLEQHACILRQKGIHLHQFELIWFRIGNFTNQLQEAMACIHRVYQWVSGANPGQWAQDVD